MRKLNLLLLFWIVFSFRLGAGGLTYQFSLDLNRVVDGKLLVTLSPPLVETDEVIYYIPKIVPGTYEIYDFGRFVSGFKAIDESGKELEVIQLDVNSWKIKQSKHLFQITYLVAPSWHSKSGVPVVFEPAGTNIEAGKNFVLNNHGFFGYLEGKKSLAYQISITHPDRFYGSTSLTDIQSQGNTDTYQVANFVKLADAPIMYNIPDTTTIHIGEASVLISAYSPNHQVTAAFIAKGITEILKAQQAYLGGTLPIRKYAFIFYFTDKVTESGNSGALEHNRSSFYVLPEMKADYLLQTLRDVAAHEFFHIVTPLSIHSEEIADFDFMVPHMSEHLWLYEGMTEYSAGLVQVKYGIIDLNTYVEMMRDKLVAASKFKDTLSFTEMSRHVVEKNYHDQYNNVYQKGALIGMCLDMKLRKLSGGSYGIQEMLRDLSKTYGPEKAFNDKELFDVITKLTYPEIGDFFKKYVIGGAPLPYKEVFGWAGITYEARQTAKTITLGNFELGYDTLLKHFTVAGITQLDQFGKKMGYQVNDEIVTLNGKELTLENAKEVINAYWGSARPGDELRMDILRKGRRGKYKRKVLRASVLAIEKVELNTLSAMPPDLLAAEQKEFRKAWINQ